MNARNIFISGMLLTVIILISVYAIYTYNNRVIINFYINETGQKLNGELYQDDISFGMVNDGKVVLIWNKIHPGDIILDIDIQNNSYPFYFEILPGFQEYSFYVYKYQIDDLTFILNNNILNNISNTIYEDINDRREINNTEKLKTDNRLIDIANNYTQKIIEYQINRTDISNDMIIKDMIDKKIFFTESNYYWFSYYINSTMNVTDEFMIRISRDNYYKTTILDKQNTNIGISSRCNKDKYCFTMMIISSNKLNRKGELKESWVQNIDIYYILKQNNIDINYPFTANISFKSKDNAKVYLVSSDKDYDKILSRDSPNDIFTENTKSFNKTIEINSGNCLVISANSDDISYEINVLENY